jgi:hypothetical protein
LPQRSTPSKEQTHIAVREIELGLIHGIIDIDRRKTAFAVLPDAPP